MRFFPSRLRAYGRGLVRRAVRVVKGEESGASSVEYALLLSLISIVAIGAMTTLGGHVKDAFTSADTAISAATGS